MSHVHTYGDCSCVVQRKDRNTHPGSSGDRWPLTRTSRLRSCPSGRLSSWRPACLEYWVYYLAVTRTASSALLGTGRRGAARLGRGCTAQVSSGGIASRSRTLGVCRRPRSSAGCASCFYHGEGGGG